MLDTRDALSVSCGADDAEAEGVMTMNPLPPTPRGACGREVASSDLGINSAGQQTTVRRLMPPYRPNRDKERGILAAAASLLRFQARPKSRASTDLLAGVRHLPGIE
jgi:hypothetical protein